MLSLHEWFDAFLKKVLPSKIFPYTQPQLNHGQHSQVFDNGSHCATLLPLRFCKIDFSKAKCLPKLAATMQHCYHSANVLLMLTLLPTTYPIGFSPIHSLHTSTPPQPLQNWLFKSQVFANVGSHCATLLPLCQCVANVNTATYHIPHSILTPPLPPHLHNLCKLTFQKPRVGQCWQPLCNTATTLPMCCQC